MEPTEILNALRSETEVKVAEEVFTDLCKHEENKPDNCFTVYQIERGLVNLFSDLTQEVYYNILFEDVSLF